MTAKNIALTGFTLLTLLLTSCSETEAKAPSGPTGIEPKKMADALFSVMKGTRTAYTRHIIARLKKTKIIKPKKVFIMW